MWICKLTSLPECINSLLKTTFSWLSLIYTQKSLLYTSQECYMSYYYVLTSDRRCCMVSFSSLVAVFRKREEGWIWCPSSSPILFSWSAPAPLLIGGNLANLDGDMTGLALLLLLLLDDTLLWCWTDITVPSSITLATLTDQRSVSTTVVYFH